MPETLTDFIREHLRHERPEGDPVMFIAGPAPELLNHDSLSCAICQEGWELEA